jgi:hypothetical protein
VIMAGGILVALAKVIAVSGANFVEGKRILELLHLRGSSPHDLTHVILVKLIARLTVGCAIVCR